MAVTHLRFLCCWRARVQAPYGVTATDMEATLSALGINRGAYNLVEC